MPKILTKKSSHAAKRTHIAKLFPVADISLLKGTFARLFKEHCILPITAERNQEAQAYANQLCQTRPRASLWREVRVVDEDRIDYHYYLVAKVTKPFSSKEFKHYQELEYRAHAKKVEVAKKEHPELANFFN